MIYYFCTYFFHIPQKSRMHLYMFDFRKINFIDTTIFNTTNQHRDDLFIFITFSNLIMIGFSFKTYFFLK